MTKLTDDEIYNRAAAVREVFEGTGHTPRSPANHVPEEEGRLAIWWKPVMRQARVGALPTRLVYIFDEAFPSWRDHLPSDAPAIPATSPILFDEGVQQIRTYLLTYGSFPAERTQLGQWVDMQRSRGRKGDLASNERSALNEVAPDWIAPGVRMTPRTAQRWATRISQLREFVITNERLPRTSLRGSDKERELHRWLSHAVEKPLDVIARTDLNVVAPGWEDLATAVAAGVNMHFVEFVHDLSEFISAHGRNPRASSRREPYERSLSHQLTTYRRRRRDLELDDEQIRVLDDQAPGWDQAAEWDRRPNDFIETQYLFDLNIKRVRAHVGRYDAWPQMTVSDRHETNLALFLDALQERFREGGLGIERFTELNENIPGWLTAQLSSSTDLQQPQDEIDVAIAAIEQRFPAIGVTDPRQLARRVVTLLREGVIDSVPGEQGPTPVPSSEPPQAEEC